MLITLGFAVLGAAAMFYFMFYVYTTSTKTTDDIHEARAQAGKNQEDIVGVKTAFDSQKESQDSLNSGFQRGIDTITKPMKSMWIFKDGETEFEPADYFNKEGIEKSIDEAMFMTAFTAQDLSVDKPFKFCMKNSEGDGSTCFSFPNSEGNTELKATTGKKIQLSSNTNVNGSLGVSDTMSIGELDPEGSGTKWTTSIDGSDLVMTQVQGQAGGRVVMPDSGLKVGEYTFSKDGINSGAYGLSQEGMKIGNAFFAWDEQASNTKIDYPISTPGMRIGSANLSYNNQGYGALDVNSNVNIGENELLAGSIRAGNLYMNGQLLQVVDGHVVVAQTPALAPLAPTGSGSG